MESDDQTRDRAKRLYQFVRGLIELRHVPVRKYPKHDTIPLDELPAKPDCSFVARGDFPDDDQERWLEVRCPKIEPYPDPPQVLVDWLEPSELADASQDMPNLLSGIRLDTEEDTAEDDESGEEVGIGTTASSMQEPPAEVKEAWERYIEDHWWPWKERTAPKYRAKKLYDDLFRMYQRQEQLGETFEIVVGFGFLSWRPTPAVEIHRPLVVAELSIELDARRQIISLQPTADGIKLQLEEDMLDPTQRPSDDIRKSVAAQLESLDSSIWSSGQIHDVLKEYCNGLSSDAEYEESLSAPKSFSDSPVVAFAPAVILRKRGNEGLLGLVDSIIEAIDAGAEIPMTVRRQVSVIEKGERGATAGAESAIEDDEIYFPLSANREQRKIVDHLRRADGVVVEGPPGTGKSQTIANLVCHLLATGKRVLVTSHTARALQVLRDKIPEEIRPLCVQALSNDAKGMDALEYSVKGITDRKWNPEDSKAAIDRLDRELADARERLQKAVQELRSIREAEVYRHEGIAGQYSGTLAQIARQLKNEQEQLGIVTDDLDPSSDLPCTQEEFRMFLAVLQNQPEVLDSALSTEPPDPSAFKPSEQFRSLVAEIRESEQTLAHAMDDANKELIERIKKGVPEFLDGSCGDCNRRLRYPNRTGMVTCPDCGASFEHSGSEVRRAAIAKAMRELAADFRSLRRQRSERWLEQAADDIFAGRDRKWKGLLDDTQTRIDALKALPPKALDARVSGHEGQQPDELRHRATTLSAYLERRAGKGLGMRLFLRKAVKDAVSVLEKVRVDGVPCVEPAAIETLKQWAEACRLLDLLDQEWGTNGEVPKGSMRSRIKEYEDACEPIVVLFRIFEKASDLSKSLQALIGETGPAWHRDAEVQVYLRALEAIDASDKHHAKEAEFVDWLQEARQAIDLIPDQGLRGELQTAITGKDHQSYARCLDTVAAVRRDWEQKYVASSVLRRLERDVPVLCQALRESPIDPQWRQLLDRWDAVWAWAQTRSWVQARVSPDADRRASSRVAEEGARIQELLAKLASARAWAFCFERLDEDQRQSLHAWANQVRLIGRTGKGKYANQHRVQARKYLTKCQPAIPAWIMPLYRVADSIRPTTERFDVAIIDEASQSGMEGLALLFLADKIVVVGDENQISPVPFTKVEDANRLRAEFVFDLPTNAALDPENSLFDLAKIRYSSRVRLIEHFRCMPEIIRFSNELCYRNEPLIPLRQFGVGRLEPVVSATHVQGGRTGGKTNRAEAIAIARKIAELVKDKRYDRKSFGVISLVSGRQSRIIESELLSLVDARELNSRSLICGEPYDFQGDERDVMFLSMVAAPSAEKAVTALADPKFRDTRRFNVAMSRARDQVWLFHSATINDLRTTDLRFKLLKYCQSPPPASSFLAGIDLAELEKAARMAVRMQDKPPNVFGSWFEVDVFLRIAARGYHVLPQFELSGYFIDLAVVGANGKLAVECDGEYWHGPDQWESDAARQRDLERCGMPFVRIRESAFYLDPEVALQSLWEALEKQGIRPQGEPEPELVPLPVCEEESVESSIEVATERPALSEKSPKLDEDQDPTLPRYEEWQPSAVPDPGSGATRESIIQALVQIVQVEGPVSWSRVFDRYRLGLELGRLKGPRREALESAARVAVRTGRLVESQELSTNDWHDAFVRVPDGKAIHLRQRGPRDLREIPPSEVAELVRFKGLVLAKNEMADHMRDSGQEDTSEEWAFRRILTCYGLRRLTGSTLDHLRKAWELATQARLV